MKPLTLTLLTFTLMALAAGSAEAGCQIQISVQNVSNVRDADVRGEAKSKGGSWRKMHKGNWGSRYGSEIHPGRTMTDIYSAAFGCGKKRRYKFVFQCQRPNSSIGPFVTKYYPSRTGWTQEQQISLSVSCRRIEAAD